MTTPSPRPPASRRPPAPALVAAVLGLLSTAIPAVFGLLALAFSNGQFGGGGWLIVLIPVLLVLALPTGAILLLVGRSWLVLTLAAGLLAALLVIGYSSGGWGDASFGVVTVLAPVATAALAALPSVRSWVAARRAVTVTP